jgi:hypothetical protein
MSPAWTCLRRGSGEAELAPLPFRGRMILKELEPVPRNYSALIWHLVRVIAKLEKDTDEPRGGPKVLR